MEKIIQVICFILITLSSSSFAAKRPGNDQLSGTVSQTQLNLYPQPTNNFLNISFSNPQQNNVKVQLFDLLGNMVGNFEAEKRDNSVYSIFVGDKTPGYYFVKIQSDDSTYSRRITINP